MNGKDALLSSLLQKSKPRPTPLIEEVDGSSAQPELEDGLAVKKTDDGPTMLELMMEAQAAAKAEKEKARVLETKKSTKSFGDGFKKGFFGSESSSKTTSKSSTSATKATVESKQQTADNIPTISKSKVPTAANKPSLVLDEVQSAMKEDEHPAMQQLKQGDWVTPDLMSQLQQNSILAAGLRNPKCTAAIQLMQKNPAEAQRRFGGDEEVDRFMREFGKVMAEHFMGLDAATRNQQQTGVARPLISEQFESEKDKAVGPLHAEVLKRHERQNSEVPLVATPANAEVDEARVQEVLSDPELREMLMDPELQRILQECGEPAKFQQHMRNLEIARKIKKLFASGLVGTVQ